MKTIDRISFYLCVFLIIYSIWKTFDYTILEIKSIKIEKQFVPLTDFELIELAIIWQESKFNSDPSNNDGLSRGLHQELPIYIREANRIVGYKKYRLSDRTNLIKSHEIFLVVQNYHNPEKNIEKAIKLHNKGTKYFNEVLNRYNCLKLYQEILIFKNK